MSDKLIKMTKIEQKRSRDLTEMNKLEAYLKEKGFKYERTDSDNTMDMTTTGWMMANLGPDFEPFDLHQIVVYDGAVRRWDDDARTGDCILCRSCLDKFENWVSRPQTECVKVGKWYSFTDYVVEMQGDNKPKEFRIVPQTEGSER